MVGTRRSIARWLTDAARWVAILYGSIGPHYAAGIAQALSRFSSTRYASFYKAAAERVFCRVWPSRRSQHCWWANQHQTDARRASITGNRRPSHRHEQARHGRSQATLPENEFRESRVASLRAV